MFPKSWYRDKMSPLKNTTGTKCRAYEHPRPPSKQIQKRHFVPGQYMSWDKMSRDKMSPDQLCQSVKSLKCISAKVGPTLVSLVVDHTCPSILTSLDVLATVLPLEIQSFTFDICFFSKQIALTLLVSLGRYT